jgi:23S rRNA (cytosine1962-C5)-methyltransferase
MFPIPQPLVCQIARGGLQPSDHGLLEQPPLEKTTARHEVGLTRKGSARIREGHPWVFRGEIAGNVSAGGGDTVRVLDDTGRFLGQAHYSSSSLIALRMISRTGEGMDFAARFAAAQRLRDLVVADTDAYRLVHAEGDFLPGLIIDRYGDCLTVQALDQAMDRALPSIVEALQRLYSPRAIVARNDAFVRTLEQLPRETKLLAGGLEQPVPIRMNGYSMEADLLHGQKTGVFLDQRENYAAAAAYARGRALDVFSCTGGFALHLSRGADSVEAVDSSAPAIETAKRNATANGAANISFREADAFDLLSSYVSSRRVFDTVVLDPPAFAKSRTQIDSALRAYKEINMKGLRLLGSGGILVTNSCSHHVDEATLLGVLADAALDAGKTLRILERRTQGRDHPVLLSVPETLYLKCVIAQVC